MSRRLVSLRRVATRARNRVKNTVRQRVTTVRARQQSIGELTDPEPTASTSILAFGGGYLVSQGGVTLRPEVAGWPVQTIAGHDYHLGPQTVLTSSVVPAGGRRDVPGGGDMTGGEGVLVLLGQPVDVAAGTAQAQVIADRLAALASQGMDPVLRGAVDLGGRWTLLVHDDSGTLSVLTDAIASQQVWCVPDGSLIASHAALAPEAAVLPADSLLQVSGQRASEHPHSLGCDDAVAEASPTDPKILLTLIRERLMAHTALLSGLGRPAIALTGGPASAAVLAAYLPHRRDDGFAFTHFAPESASEGPAAAEDMFVASRLAQQVGLEHRVLRAQEPPKDHQLALALRETFPEATSLAGAFARHALPRDVIELHSAGAESAARGPTDFRLGDLSHRVLLPFNDRHLLALMRALPPHLRESGELLRALGAGLPEKE